MDVRRRHEELRRRLATAAAEMAELADRSADFVQSLADGGRDTSRMRFVAWEREVATVQRRNAERLRNGDVHRLEAVPAYLPPTSRRPTYPLR